MRLCAADFDRHNGRRAAGPKLNPQIATIKPRRASDVNTGEVKTVCRAGTNRHSDHRLER